MQNILDFGRNDFDQSIIRATFHPYTPYNALNINSSDEVRICINNQDLITLPSQSYLYIKGKFSHKDNGHFIKNGLSFLFDEIRYEIASKEVDSVRNPGITSFMKFICSTNPSKDKRYSNACIDDDEGLKKITTEGEFSGCIPLEMLMGFFEDYDKALINVKQELILKIARNSMNAIYTTKADTPATTTAAAVIAAIPTVTISEIQWFMPHIQTSDSERAAIQTMVSQSKSLNIRFRSYELHTMPAYPTNTKKHTWAVKTTTQLETPRYVIFGFQTARDNAARKRCDRFDHCSLQNIKVFLNSEYYPYADLNLDFEKKDIAKAYEMFARFQESYYNTTSEPCLNRDEFINKYPLIVIDCSKQNEAIKEGVIDLKIEIQTAENVPDNTTAYCLVIHRKEFEYNPLTNEVSRV